MLKDGRTLEHFCDKKILFGRPARCCSEHLFKVRMPERSQGLDCIQDVLYYDKNLKVSLVWPSQHTLDLVSESTLIQRTSTVRDDVNVERVAVTVASCEGSSKYTRAVQKGRSKRMANLDAIPELVWRAEDDNGKSRRMTVGGRNTETQEQHSRFYVRETIVLYRAVCCACGFCCRRRHNGHCTGVRGPRFKSILKSMNDELVGLQHVYERRRSCH